MGYCRCDIYFVYCEIISHLSVDVVTSNVYHISTCSRLFISGLSQDVIYRCPRRNGQNFGRVFLMLKYTDITQNTYFQS